MLKKTIVEKLANYFAEKGKMMTAFEYKQQSDTPIHPIIIKRHIGRWVKLEHFIKIRYPEQYALATGVTKKVETAPTKKVVGKTQAPPTVIEPAVEETIKDEDAK